MTIPMLNRILPPVGVAIALLASGLLASCASHTRSAPEAPVPPAAVTAEGTQAATAPPSSEVGEQEADAEVPATPSDEAEEAREKDLEEAAELAAREEVMARRRGRELQPPDGKWLIDDQGREYFVEKIEKVKGAYEMIGENRVRMRWIAFAVDIVGQDEKFFYVKMYRLRAGAPPAPKGPTGDEIAAIEATYLPVAEPSSTLAFERIGNGLPGSGQWRNGFDLADMNGDGHLDLVHGPTRKGSGIPMIFLGDGQGGFQRWREARFPRAAYDYGAAAVGDFNGDGHLDVGLAVHLRGVLALLGDGKGSFQLANRGLEFEVPGKGGGAHTYSSRALATVDWDGDGNDELLVVGEGLGGFSRPEQGQASSLHHAYGKALWDLSAGGEWIQRHRSPAEDRTYGDAITLGDFNGDGRLDFATGLSTQEDRRSLNLALSDGFWEAALLPTARPRSYPRAVAAADFNGDGRDDLAVGHKSYEGETWRSGVDVHLSQADGSWVRSTLSAVVGRTGVSAVGAGDLDGDGDRDLVAATGDGGLWVFIGDGRGGFSREPAKELVAAGGGCQGFALRLADLDGQAGDEIVAAFAGDDCPGNGSLQAWRAKKIS